MGFLPPTFQGFRASLVHTLLSRLSPWPLVGSPVWGWSLFVKGIVVPGATSPSPPRHCALEEGPGGREGLLLVNFPMVELRLPLFICNTDCVLLGKIQL